MAYTDYHINLLEIALKIRLFVHFYKLLQWSFLSPFLQHLKEKRNSSLLHYFFQKVHNIISVDPGNYVCLELSRLELLHLHQQPVHGVVPPGEGGVPGSQGLSGAHVIGPVTDIKHPLETNTAALLLPVSQVLSKDCLLAHVFGATRAGV